MRLQVLLIYPPLCLITARMYAKISQLRHSSKYVLFRHSLGKAFARPRQGLGKAYARVCQGFDKDDAVA